MHFVTGKQLPRRTFLRGAMGATVALPFLDAMVAAKGAGAAPAAAERTRLIAIEEVHGLAGCNKWGATKNLFAPAETGIEKMDMNTGRVEILISLKRMAEIAFPQGYKGKTNLYFFREGWNPSGTRFIAFLKNADRPVHTSGWS